MKESYEMPTIEIVNFSTDVELKGTSNEFFDPDVDNEGWV